MFANDEPSFGRKSKKGGSVFFLGKKTPFLLCISSDRPKNFAQHVPLYKIDRIIYLKLRSILNKGTCYAKLLGLSLEMHNRTRGRKCILHIVKENV